MRAFAGLYVVTVFALVAVSLVGALAGGAS